MAKTSGGITAPHNPQIVRTTTAKPPKPNRNKNRNRNQNGNRNKGNKNKGNKGNQNKQQKSSPPAAHGAYAPKEILEGPHLRKAVQQIVNFQTRPGIRQANRAIAESEKEREKDIGREKNLGQQAGVNIADYYHKLAADETEKLLGIEKANEAAKAGVAESGRETLAGIAAAGKEGTEGIGAYEGQDISSRDRLAQMIAQYGATAANQNNALNAEANEKGQAWSGLMGMEGLAGQQRGGQILGDTRRQVLGQIGSLKREYGSDISKLKGAKLELLLQRPELAAKALSELTERERNYILSKATLGLEKKKLGSEEKGKTGGVAYSNVNTANLIKLKKLEQRQRLQELAASGASYEQLQAQKAQDSKEIIELQQSGYGKGGSGGSKAGGYLPFGKVFSILRGSPISGKDLFEGYMHEGKKSPAKQVRKQAYDKLRASGATDKTAKKAIKKLINQYRKQKNLQAAPAHPGH